jgi:hypothetical protein
MPTSSQKRSNHSFRQFTFGQNYIYYGIPELETPQLQCHIVQVKGFT